MGDYRSDEKALDNTFMAWTILRRCAGARAASFGARASCVPWRALARMERPLGVRTSSSWRRSLWHARRLTNWRVTRPSIRRDALGCDEPRGPAAAGVGRGQR